MTTCAYDGRYLATDSRSTGGASSRKPYKCSHCGEESHRINDEAVKIYGDFGDKKYRGELIYAVAGSGSSSDVSKLIDLIRKGEDVDEVYRILQLVADYRVAFDSTFLIVTEKSVFILKNHMDTKKVVVKRHERTEKLAIGSGSTAARFAMRSLNMTAMESIMASCIGDEHTGGNIRWVDCENPAGKPETHNIIELTSDEETIKGVQGIVSARFNQPIVKLPAKKTSGTRRSKVTA